jgi:hypothetical protein
MPMSFPRRFTGVLRGLVYGYWLEFDKHHVLEARAMRALARHPGDFVAMFYLSHSLIKQRRPSEACAMLGRMLDVHSVAEKTQLRLVREALSMFLRQESYSQAISCAQGLMGRQKIARSARYLLLRGLVEAKYKLSEYEDARSSVHEIEQEFSTEPGALDFVEAYRDAMR